MDEVADSGSNSRPRSLSVSPQDKESKNKRKLGNPSEFVSLEVGLDQPRKEPTDWDDPLACQLEELLLSNLQEIFRSAINQIAEHGYSAEVAEKLVSRGGIYLGGKDPESNIVNDSVKFLREGKDVDVSRDDVFDNLQHLVEYTMLEMIGVLREVRPSLSIGEAMWWLLICDLNVSQACALEADFFSGFGSKDVSGGSSSDSAIPRLRSEAQSSETILADSNKPIFPNPLQNAQNSLTEALKFGSFPNFPKPNDPLGAEGVTPERENLESLSCTTENSLGTAGEFFHITSQSYTAEEKSGAGQKGRTKKELAALRQKSFHMDQSFKAYGSKGGLKSGKVAAVGGFLLERRLKHLSKLAGAQTKNASSKNSTEVGKEVPLADGNLHVSKSTPSALPATDHSSTFPMKATTLPKADTQLSNPSSSEKKSNPKAQRSTSETPQIPNYYAGIPYDKSLGKYVAQDEKDELILKLVPRLQELQKELQGWTEWANQKVMQAARRLSTDQPELKALRLEKKELEQCIKEEQIFEESTTKRLSEMENAFGNATGQIEQANSTANRLEVEHSILKMELEAAKLRAFESAASYQVAVEREQVALKRALSLEGQKGLLQDGLNTEKHRMAELQQELGKAKNCHNQIEARWKQERMANEKVLAHSASIRKEREQIEARAKAEEEVIRQKAENDMKKYMEDIKKLETKLSQMKFESNASRIAALRRGIDGGSGSCLADKKRARVLKLERECVMCLTEERSVVFLPCAHQVVCVKCNELHEKRGMKDCPSCRTPIQQRVIVRFARP